MTYSIWEVPFRQRMMIQVLQLIRFFNIGYKICISFEVLYHVHMLFFVSSALQGQLGDIDMIAHNQMINHTQMVHSHFDYCVRYLDLMSNKIQRMV